MFYLTTHSTHFIYGYMASDMVKDHSDSERGNPLPPHGLLFSINSEILTTPASLSFNDSQDIIKTINAWHLFDRFYFRYMAIGPDSTYWTQMVTAGTGSQYTDSTMHSVPSS